MRVGLRLHAEVLGRRIRAPGLAVGYEESLRWGKSIPICPGAVFAGKNAFQSHESNPQTAVVRSVLA
jgi:hypothetical protein